MPERGIPRSVLRNAKGLAILTVVKIGFGLSGKGGQGVVVARTGSGWSGPSFLGTGGAGWGLQIGAEITEYVLILNTNRAVHAFSRDGNFTLGADASVAAGPVGRSSAADTDLKLQAEILTYSRSRGVFAGIALNGATLRPDKETNTELYGAGVTNKQIVMGGKKRSPVAAAELTAKLNKYSAREE